MKALFSHHVNERDQQIFYTPVTDHDLDMRHYFFVRDAKTPLGSLDDDSNIRRIAYGMVVGLFILFALLAVACRAT